MKSNRNQENLMKNSNIRTMELIGVDDFNYYVYKCIETGILYKGEIIGDEETPRQLYSCGNEFDGEPCYPINKDLEIKFLESKEKRPTKEERFNYQMLGRLKMDCDYYLGNGNRYKNHLWAGDEQEQINKMKELYNSFSNDKKPEWLTYNQILQYEKLMINS
ncbi:LPD11 domain-containing protein [uncultured Clostridium sp.]|uniref:LPD11 domain-containing protein n=1 Tax=uncultured Clostridium sp. TaxID=59620 RepID=UPI0028E312FE|nr:LPD11 domain-containing protein [uncultured Clostridium sp.]